LFGRAQEEIDALRAAGVRCEVVPGVTAALAASAGLQISLTRRGMSRNVTFVTPRVGAGEEAGDWVKSVCNADSAVMYMAAGQSSAIAAKLIASGMPVDMPVVIVENASLPGMQQIATTLGELQNTAEQLTHGGPALLMIGRVFARAKSAEHRGVDQTAVQEALVAALSA
jgi:uroporphyrin-III C-methyltransferase